MIESLRITDFKKIKEAELTLNPINVLVGSNNSGKSCLLQGIHFGVNLAQSRELAGSEQFPPADLRYCPTDDFLDLRHDKRLTEGATVRFTFGRSEGGTNVNATVELQRGRNGVVKARTSGSTLPNEISDPKGFFSIYVPGLAGVSIREEYRSELVVNNGIARGDANLYLRNVLLRLERSEDRKDRFRSYLASVFPNISVKTLFNEANDQYIRSQVILNGGDTRPLDMVGTGLLQGIQIFAYVANYRPKILLLDEPDAHLHLNNQRLLAKALLTITENTDTKIILATHSRHLIDAVSEIPAAKLYWMKNGTAQHQEIWSDIAILMDLGALDSGERLLAGNVENVIWTEDTERKFLEVFLQSNGIELDRSYIFSYSASSKVDAARLMASFLMDVRPGVKAIIHRDRDFMSDEEICRLKRKHNLGQFSNMRLFVTRMSDIESYFLSFDHLNATLGLPIEECRILIESTIAENLIEFSLAFREKREEIKRSLYRRDPESCPDTNALLTGSQVPVEKSVGKLLLKKLGPKLQDLGKNPRDILTPTPFLRDPFFSQAIA